jgi:asparagine synthetase B (glutamine-hydrolysing)
MSVRPLFWVKTNNNFAFSSTLKSLCMLDNFKNI